MIQTAHTSVLHALAQLTQRNHSLKISAAVTQLCVVIINMINYKCSAAAKSDLVDILKYVYTLLIVC